MHSLLKVAFPPQCLSCDARVEDAFGLCGPCWRDTPFVTGVVCKTCGVPLPSAGPATVWDATAQCDDCLRIARPWELGRTALLYQGNARRMVLALKHGDRLDMVPLLARWMAGVSDPLVRPDSVLVPVPAYPLRLLQRRYNQAAVLANAVAKTIDRAALPDLLRRTKRTSPQDGKTVQERFDNLRGAIQPARWAERRLAGRPVILVDDVMTSGATLAEATEACYAVGACRVDILSLARVSKAP